MLSATIHSKSKRVLADDLGEIVGELDVPEMVVPTRSCPMLVMEPSAKLKVGKASPVGCEARFMG